MINAAEFKSLADTTDPIAAGRAVGGTDISDFRAEERAVEGAPQGAPKDGPSVSDNDSLFEELETPASPSVEAELFAPEAAPEPESFEFTLEELSDGDFRDFSNSIFACLIGFRNPSEKKAFPLYEDIKDKKVHLLFSKVRLKSLTENSVELNEIQKEIIDQLYGTSAIIEAADILMSVTGANIYGCFLRGTDEEIVEKMRIAARRYVENNAELNDDRAQLNAQITALEEKVRQAQRENAQIEVLKLKEVAALNKRLEEETATHQAALGKALEESRRAEEASAAIMAKLNDSQAEVERLTKALLAEESAHTEAMRKAQETQLAELDAIRVSLEASEARRAKAEETSTRLNAWIANFGKEAFDLTRSQD